MFKTIPQTDFSGGANYVVNPYLVSQKQAAAINNLTLDEHGSLRTRGGLRFATQGPLTSPIVYRNVFVKVNGTQIPLAIYNVGTGNKLYQTAPVWSLVGTFTTAEKIPWSFGINDKYIFLNGYETPFEYNGTTFVRITAGAGQTVPPGAKHGLFHLGAMWIWNTSATTTTLDGPSSLRASDPNNPDSWPNANQTFISKDDGQVGMGCSSFTIVETGISPTATLVLFKNFSTYEVTGVFGASNFSVQQVKSDMGCIAPRTIQFVSGFGIIRLTHKGFALYNGVEDRLISEEVRPQIFGGISGEHFISAVDFASIDTAWGVQVPNPPLYIAACPEFSNAGLTKLFIYDLVRRAWSMATVPVPVSSLVLLLQPGAVPHVQVGAFNNGRIYTFFPISVYIDSTQNDVLVRIPWSVRTKAYFNTNQMHSTYFRRGLFNVMGQPLYPVDITPIIDGVPDEKQRHYFPDIGIGQPPPNNIPQLSETVMSVDIMRSGHTIQYLVEGEGRFHLRGIETHTIEKPPTRYGQIKKFGTTEPFVAPVITTLTLSKTLDPSDDPGKFDVYVDTFPSSPSHLVLEGIGGGASISTTISPGTYQIAELGNPASGTDIADYTVTFGGDANSTGVVVIPEGTTKAVTITNSIGGTRLLTTGFEEGNSWVFRDGGNVLHSTVFTEGSAYINNPPHIVTDFVHSGTYSLQYNDTPGMSKNLNPTYTAPYTLSLKAYLLIHTLPSTNGDRLGVLAFSRSTPDPVTDPPVLLIGLKRISSTTAAVFMENNSTSGSHHQETGGILSVDTWYRVVASITVQSNDTTWSSKCRVYANNATTATATLTDSGTDYVSQTRAVNKFSISPYYGTATGVWDIRIDDLVFVNGIVSPNPIGIALISPNTDVSVQWTKAGSAPAASNALNIGYLDSDWPDDSLKHNDANTSAKVDRYTVRGEGSPANTSVLVSRIDVYHRSDLNATNTLKLSVWDNLGNQTLSPEISTFDTGFSARTDTHLVLGTPGKTFANILSYNLGIRSEGAGSSTRVVKTLWANVEYTPS